MVLILVKHKRNLTPEAFMEAERKRLERLNRGESPEIVMARKEWPWDIT